MWYWILAVFLLLWNLMGVYSFYYHIFISEEELLVLLEAEIALYTGYPFWTKIAFAFAVFGGTIGSIELVMRKDGRNQHLSSL